MPVFTAWNLYIDAACATPMSTVIVGGEVWLGVLANLLFVAQELLAFLENCCNGVDCKAKANPSNIPVSETLKDVIFRLKAKPAHAKTAAKYCVFIKRIAVNSKSAGCDVIIKTEPALYEVFDILGTWMQEERVVEYACSAVYELIKNGSDDVQHYMRKYPHYDDRLRSVAATGIRGSFMAAKALGKLQAFESTA